LRHIAGRNDRKVYGAIDDADAGAAVSRPTLIDDGKETPRGGGTPCPLAAAGQNLVLGADLRLDAAPLGQNLSDCDGLGIESKRLGLGTSGALNRNGRAEMAAPLSAGSARSIGAAA
jgi:hypothetical protein